MNYKIWKSLTDRQTEGTGQGELLSMPVLKRCKPLKLLTFKWFGKGLVLPTKNLTNKVHTKNIENVV